MLKLCKVVLNEWFEQDGGRPRPLVISSLTLHQLEELREGLMEALLKHVIADVV